MLVDREFELKLHEKRVLAVLTIEKAEHAVPVARALLKGGVSGIELALRTPAAIESIRRVVQEVPEMCVGVGTVIRPDQCHEIARLGVDFGLSPGMNPRVIKAARKAGLPFVPGFATAGELEQAVELGCRVLKLFPSASFGGVQYLKRLDGPYGFLDLKYVPLGGVNEDNLGEYLSYPGVAAVGGSWIAKRELIREEQWDTIARNAERAMKVARQAGGET